MPSGSLSFKHRVHSYSAINTRIPSAAKWATESHKCGQAKTLANQRINGANAPADEYWRLLTSAASCGARRLPPARPNIHPHTIPVPGRAAATSHPPLSTGHVTEPAGAPRRGVSVQCETLGFGGKTDPMSAQRDLERRVTHATKSPYRQAVHWLNIYFSTFVHP